MKHISAVIRRSCTLNRKSHVSTNLYLRKFPSDPGCVTSRPASIIWMDGDCAALPPQYSKVPTPYKHYFDILKSYFKLIRIIDGN